ncbi:Protein phosphatase PTC7 [Grifola frondosa]|uniref:Protein phosphatase n=1 Tax=Grifola frondosa TaxID=5627 RepID=A0A1C7ME02_GRIFR|nr:Protein phosphatase PTC7 [Grifola frondosa]
MLIRGDEVIWRTEEMWWNFNTPVQLGPSSPTRARDAQVFAVPVQADDILVLASDGLSDNLWDEEILDEVVRFRRTFMLEHAPPPPRMRDASPVRAFRRTTLAECSARRCARGRGACQRSRG